MMRAEDDGFTRMFLTVQLVWRQVSSEMRLCYSPLFFFPLGGGVGVGILNKVLYGKVQH